MYNIFRKLSKTEKKGIGFGFGSPILYSIDSVLDILLFALVFGVGYKENMAFWQIICYSFVTSFMKDFLLYLFMEIRQNFKTFKKYFHLMKHKKRAFWWTFFGSLSGGPLGFTLTTASILYSGAAYGSALANFSPVLVLLFAIKFFQTKLTKIGWLGVFLAIVGFLGLSFLSSFLEDKNNFNFNLKTFIGVLLAILAVFTWSVETIVSEYVEKFGEGQSLNDKEKLTIKSISSSFSTLFFFLPLSMLIAFLSNAFDDVESMFAKLFASWKAWVILIIIGLVIVTGRTCYWYAISHIGGGRADILYYLTVLFTPLLVVVLSVTGVPGFKEPPGVSSYLYWIFLFTQISGVFMITFFSKNSKVHIFKKTSKKFKKIKK